MDYSEIHYFASGLVSIATCCALYKLISSQYKISSNKRIIKEIKKAPLKIPQEVSSQEQGKNIIVHGRVQKNTVDARNKQIFRRTDKNIQQQYVFHFQFKEPIYSNDDFDKEKSDYSFNLQQIIGRGVMDSHPTFQLAGDKNNLLKILVKNYELNNGYERALEITRWKLNKRKLNFTQKFQTLIYSYFRALGTLVFTDRRSQLIRGLNIGDREVECGIKVGSSLMALGTVGLTAQGQFFIEPQFLFKDRLSYIGYLQDIIDGSQESRNFWLIMSVLGLLYISRRAYHYNKKNKIWEKVKKQLNLH